MKFFLFFLLIVFLMVWFVKPLRDFFWNILPASWQNHLKGVWEDTTEPKTKEVKEKGKIVQKPVLDDSGNPVLVVAKPGRKHGFFKRVGWFTLGVVAVLGFQYILGLFGESIVFRIILAGIITWLITAPLRKYRLWHLVIIVPLMVVLVVLSIAYLPEFKHTFASATNWLVGVSLLTFVLEEVTDTELYPRSVAYGGLVVIVLMFILAGVDLLRPHEYFEHQNRAVISVEDQLTETTAWEKLKAEFQPSKPAPGAWHRFPAELTGDDDQKTKTAETWLKSFVRNNLPVEYGRVEAVMTKLFFIVYFIMAYIVFMLIAIPEIISEAIDKYKAMPKKTEQKNLLPWIYVIIDSVTDSVFKHRGGRK